MSIIAGTTFSSIPITPRQVQILECLANGMTYKQISRTLEISVRMIKTHVRHAKSRLRAETKEQAIAMAVSDKLLVVMNKTIKE